MEVHKAAAILPVSREMLVDRLPSVEDMVRMVVKRRRAFEALPPEDQARVRADQEVVDEQVRIAYEADRCPRCGCHPVEHSDY